MCVCFTFWEIICAWGWPYNYCDYHGFINITLVGNRFFQHNIFVYPPATTEFCNTTAVNPGAVKVKGNGICGVNGGEKIFEAFSTLTEDGGTEMTSLPMGTYASFTSVTRPIDINTLLYTSSNDERMHIQMNVFFPDDNHRYRTAYGFDYGASGEAPLSSHSMYLEEKVDEETWLRRLGEVREEFNVTEADHAGEYPLTQACFADNMGNCWTEEAFCAEGMDPTCAPKKDSSDDGQWSTLTTILLVVCILLILLIIPLVFYYRKYKYESEISAGELCLASMDDQDFNWLDKDHDRQLNADEIRDGLARLGHVLSKEQVNTIITHMNYGKDTEDLPKKSVKLETVGSQVFRNHALEVKGVE